MKSVGVVGLGLIGGSLARALKARGECRVLGYDIQESVRLRAKLVHAVDEELTDGRLAELDMLILALYPQATIQWMEEKAHLLRPGTNQ